MGDNRKLCFEELDLTRRKVNSDCENWLRALESLKTAVKGLIETRNLSGDTKDNTSSYLQLFYGQTITALEEAIRHHDAAFSAYVSEYESNNMGGSTVIHTEELEEAKEELAKTIPKFTSVHKSAKSTKNSVSAIVAGLPSGNTKTYDEPKEEIQTQIIDWTLNKISSIEMGNFEGASSPVIEQVRAMIKNNSAKSVSVRMIQFNPSDFNSSKDVKALTDARNKLRECDENNKEKYDAARKKYDIVDPVERDVKAGTETVDDAAEQGVNDVVNGDEEEALLDENAVGGGESSPVSGGSHSPSGSHSDSSNSFRSSTSDEETSELKNDTKDVSQVDTAEVKSKVTPIVPPVTPSDTTPGDASEKDEVKQFISPDKDPSVTTPTDTTPVKNEPDDPKPADTSQEATDGTKPYVSPDKDPSASDPKPADTSQEATDGTKPYVSPDKDPSASDPKPADTSQEATDGTKPYVSPDKDPSASDPKPADTSQEATADTSQGTTDVAVSDGETSESSSGTTSLEKPVETPQDTHTETPVETPQDTHTEAPAETPQEAHETTIISEEMSSGEESGSTPIEKPVESSQEPQIATPAETPTESGDSSTTPVGESSNQEKTEATYSFVDDEELLKKLV